MQVVSTLSLYDLNWKQLTKLTTPKRGCDFFVCNGVYTVMFLCERSSL